MKRTIIEFRIALSAIALSLALACGSCIVLVARQGGSSQQVQVQPTQVEVQQPTNALDRAKPTTTPISTNLNWFIQDSNYIWDGWQLK